MKVNFTPFLLGFVFALASCSEEETKTELSADFDVVYRTEFKNTIYPSLIFGLSELEKIENEPADYFFVNIKPNIETDIRIVIEESKVNFETVITSSNVRGEKQIVPEIKWKYDDLKNLSQPGNVDMTFVCYGKDDKELGRKNLKLSYRAINECVFAAMIDGEVLPLWWMFAAYVNEDSPIIDDFLQEVLENTDLQSFSGYQQGEEGVLQQVNAIFQTLRDKGIKYSSITNTSNSNSNIASQYIRFTDEVLNNTQANCADGTAFFCSVLKKIDIKPVMVFVPGHVYLGYYADAQKTQLYLLETTMVGDLTFDFLNATDAQVDSFNANADKLFDSDSFDGYLIVDIEAARQFIRPIGR